MRRLSFIAVILMCSFTLGSSVHANKPQQPEAAFEFDDLPDDAVLSDGQGVYAPAQISSNLIRVISRDLRGRLLYLDLTDGDVDPLFNNGETAGFVSDVRIELRRNGIGNLEVGDPPLDVWVVIYFSIGEREFDVDLRAANQQADPPLAYREVDGTLRLISGPTTEAIVQEYIGNGRNTQIPVLGRVQLPFGLSVVEQ